MQCEAFFLNLRCVLPGLLWRVPVSTLTLYGAFVGTKDTPHSSGRLDVPLCEVKYIQIRIPRQAPGLEAKQGMLSSSPCLCRAPLWLRSPRGWPPPVSSPVPCLL